MTFSKTTTYALRILTVMASNPDKMYTSISLNELLEIPKKYLQRLLTDLSRSGIIKSIQGRNGGFILARNAGKITVASIVEAVEGLSEEVSCFFGFEKCALDKPCSMHDVWTKTHKDIISLLKSTKLSDLKNTRLVN
jgi:Rrf2 family protein